MTDQQTHQPNRRCPPSTYGMRLRGAEWQVCHGNKIIGRFTGPTAEADAETMLRAKIRKPGAGAAP